MPLPTQMSDDPFEDDCYPFLDENDMTENDDNDNDSDDDEGRWWDREKGSKRSRRRSRPPFEQLPGLNRSTPLPPLDRISQLTMTMMAVPGNGGVGGVEKKRPVISAASPTDGLKHLLQRVDLLTASNQAQRRLLRGLILEARPSRSKWADPNRIGQAELYDGLERVWLELKAFTPYAVPFTHRVSRKEVPDYYDIIQEPMDLQTMGKKLKALEYPSKAAFVADLQLIYDNCFQYNTDPNSLLRQHVTLLREKWIRLLMEVPNITIQRREDVEANELAEEELAEKNETQPVPLPVQTRRLATPRRSGRGMALFAQNDEIWSPHWLHNALPDTLCWYGVRPETRHVERRETRYDHGRELSECLGLQRQLMALAYGEGEIMQDSNLPSCDHPPADSLEARSILFGFIVPLLQSAGFTHCSLACLNILGDLVEDLLHRMGMALAASGAEGVMRVEGVGLPAQLNLYAKSHYAHLAQTLRQAIEVCQEIPQPEAQIPPSPESEDLETVSLGEDDVDLITPSQALAGDDDLANAFGLKPMLPLAEESGDYEGFASAFRVTKR